MTHGPRTAERGAYAPIQNRVDAIVVGTTEADGTGDAVELGERLSDNARGTRTANTATTSELAIGGLV